MVTLLDAADDIDRADAPREPWVRDAARLRVAAILWQVRQSAPATSAELEMVVWQPRRSAFIAYGFSALSVVAATVVGWPLSRIVPAGSIVLLYLIATLYTAIAFGFGPSLFASLLGVLCFDFFFLLPYYTLYIADPADTVRLAAFGIVAFVVSNLAARVRRQAINADQRAKTSEDLYRLSRELARAVTLQDVLHAIVTTGAAMLKVPVVVLLADGDRLDGQIGTDPIAVLGPADLAAADWCLAQGRTTAPDTATAPRSRWQFVPMHSGRGISGVIGVLPPATGNADSAELQRLLGAIADQAAQAIERVRLGGDLDQASRAAERDRLHAALLSSISHDLRTPLASILGSASDLINHTVATDEALRVELAQTIRDEAERLNRYIGNLLDMTRLESGMLRAETVAVDLIDVVGAAIERCGRIVANHDIQVDLPPNLPLLAVDEVLLEHVLFNLLDNAAKYTPPGTQIRIAGRQDGGNLVVQVIDEGNGIPTTELDRIFDKFYRIQRGDWQRAGTGLGLAICRGFIDAMGGTIIAGNRTDRTGAVFTVTLKLPSDPGLSAADMD
jgi:two-component system sensor histidine kinase KdpD